MATNVTITPLRTHDGAYTGEWRVTNDEDSNDSIDFCGSNVEALESYDDDRCKIAFVCYFDRAKGIERTFPFSARHVASNWK